jgi:purine nucleosidase
MRALAIAALVLGAAVLLMFAMPIEIWRTGDQGLEPLTFEPSAPRPDLPRRLWIDTDAACGHSARTDPDDCLALALLARARHFEIVGISAVAGNAPLEIVERTTRELARRLSADLGRPLPVRSAQALAAALEEGPLVIVALGPLTNLAAVLEARPDLRARVARLVAVMGRRPGHIFHPSEGAGGGMLLGHGPVFRDFNYEMDARAAAQIVRMQLPLTLVPYDAARRIEIGARDLDQLAASGGALAWTADRSRGWLAYWQEDIGRQGFCPFDLLAAAYLVEPRRFGCAAVQAWIGKDSTLFIPFWQPTALLIGRGDAHLQTPHPAGPALYCARVGTDFKSRLMARLLP